jgi:hypothetical protein
MRRLALILTTLTMTAAAAADDASLSALRATVRLHGGGSSGTAFLLALPGAEPPLLVSAAHTFEKVAGDSCTVVCRGPTADGAADRREVAVTIREGGKPRWVRHPTADVAVLPWTPPPDVDAVAFPFEWLATAAAFDGGDVRVGQRVRVACHPAQTEANAAGWAVLRTGAIATHPLTPAATLERFFVDYAHYGGDSGAAVVRDDGGEPAVIGVVVAMQRQTDRVTSPFEEKTVHTPLGLAITVPSTLVHETIDRWREQTAGERVSSR